ncbi:DUF2637 domain-containing protein [Actinoplanes sichuanensis]|uniref:DUF2637 domain-containing protein n=1 Tax=Actinoplanes sichuanensis TaxID=512349 RepID=A0ABW4A1B6_9ACTN|nr:DUF2637 domain-containing protein [Actinoplanes sichuanensis]
MLAIGAAAGAASFTHVHDVAAAHGQPGWLAWADAVVLELMSIAGGLELRRRKRIGAHLSFPAVVLVVAVVLSLGAQVVEAEPSIIGWIAAALPAAGFLAMVKIALGRTESGPAQSNTTARDTPAENGTVRDEGTGNGTAVRDEGTGNRTAVRDERTGNRTAVRDEGTGDKAVRDGMGDRWAGRAGPGDGRDEPRAVRDERRSATGIVRDGPGRPDKPTPAGTDTDPDVRAMLPAARDAADRLADQGRPLSREALAEVLRGQGHAMSNARVSALVRLIREQPVAHDPAIRSPTVAQSPR